MTETQTTLVSLIDYRARQLAVEHLHGAYKAMRAAFKIHGEWTPVRDMKKGDYYISVAGLPVQVIWVNKSGELLGHHIFIKAEDRQHSWHSVERIGRDYIEAVSPWIGYWRAFVISESEDQFVNKMMGVYLG